jgi:hypothetical protein
MWWCMSLIPALWWLRLEDHEFKASLDYIVRLCLNNRNSCEVHLGIKSKIKFLNSTE